ncbi:TlpA family protein disulfide reductase [Frateuria terrea]|uniref:Thiol-disulfide isomerase or thioredoxin n=1 Tax=Frateuria terrea TaxID=529704 RepID=A0A1H6WS49_9GAMM|nr:TlpA disulfide reductase family protein [Frateuria terrea]SEJ17087.1 Thiol-disulfide isomerase or thioredoxin [Frateuria terrea]SFP56194.1 Thiol-disulfide isomerase or thioredoxin [Frateuria terrea]
MMTRASWLILALAVLAAAAGGWLQHASRERHGQDLVGRPAPVMQLSDLDEHAHVLSDYAGRRVLVNLWASWCGPCRKEMPALVAAQARFGGDRPAVIGIAMDTPENVRAYLKAHPVNYPILLGRLDDPDSARQLGDGAGVLPYSVLLDADGKVLASHVGTLHAATLERWLDKDSP